MNRKIFSQIAIDPASREPRYLQVAEQLRRAIVDARLSEGSRLPSDNDLVRQTGLSLFTVRQAVGELVKAGLAERLHGKGTFLKAPGGEPTHGQVALFIDEKQVARQYSSFYTVLFHHLIRALDDHAVPVRKIYLDAPEKILAEAYRYRAAGLRKAVFLFPEIIPDYRLLSSLTGIPAIFVDHYVEAEHTACVMSPNYAGGRQAAEYLRQCGCRSLAFLGDTESRYNYLRRAAGFADALQLPTVNDRMFDDWTVLAEAIGQHRFDGVVCCSDWTAVNLADELAARGLKTPDNVKIIAYDGTTLLDGRTPSITALRVDLKDMAEQVCTAIDDSRTDGRYECRLTLVEGDSTR